MGSGVDARVSPTCLALAFLLDKDTVCNDAKGSTDIIFLDFARAFDKVPHERLMLKLKAHGIDGHVARWISDWLSSLTNRLQRVFVSGATSGWRRVISGVPQGSVRGPLLFLIFINDLDLGLLNTILKFADDTKIFGKVWTLSDRLQLQTDLDNLCTWADNWQVTFNVSKCKVMHIGSRNANYSYSMNRQLLDEVTEHKDLGIIRPRRSRSAAAYSHQTFP